MARFDDWVTDREITIEKARPFVENHGLFGKQFLDKYLVITTSGTTGTHGIFLIDKRTLSVVGPLFLRMLSVWLGASDIIRIIAGGGRMALVLATGTPTRLLTAYKLDHIKLERAGEPPEQSPGGKYREVVPLKENI